MDHHLSPDPGSRRGDHVPAALAIVLGAFPVRERGRAMAILFAITGGLTSIGPLAGGYLVEWTWRAIFWVNIPVAIIALILTAIAKPDDEKHPAPLDYRGTVLISGGMGLDSVVFALLVPYVALGHTLLYFDSRPRAEEAPAKRRRERFNRSAIRTGQVASSESR